MKTFNDFRKLSLFIVWVLVVLLAGIGTTIYANEDPNQDAKNDKIKITLSLEPGEVGKKYIKRLPFSTESENEKWKILPQEQAKLPDGLTFSSNGILEGTPTKKGEYKFEVSDPNDNNITYEISQPINPINPFSQSENLRIITGYEISRASATTGSEKAFLDVYLSQPLPFFRIKKGKLIVWGNIRFTSTPRQNDKAIGAVSTDYFSTLSDLKLNEMTQSVEFLGGIEYNLFSIKKSNEGEYNYTLGLTVAYGGSTPMVSETNPQLVVFNMPKCDQLIRLKTRYPEYNFDGKDFISFVPEDRESFFHQYYFGFRLKAYTNENGNSKLPVTIDISYGMNQAASGGIGKLLTKKSVVRFDGFLPIEILHIPIYLFGTVCINVAKDDTVHTPLILGELVSGNDKPPVDFDKLLIVTEKPNKRDFFKVGIGIDLYKIFKTSQDTAKRLNVAEAKTDANKEAMIKIQTTLEELKKEKQDTEDTRKNLEEKLKAAEDTRKKYEDELKKLKAQDATNPQSGTQN